MHEERRARAEAAHGDGRQLNMPNDIADIEAKIRSLSVEDKAALIRGLIADLDDPIEAGVEQAWLDEAQRRYSRDGRR